MRESNQDPTLPSVLKQRSVSAWATLLVSGASLGAFYCLLTVARTWLGPATPAAIISQRPSALPGYAAQSLLRMIVAYVLSLAFALVYGYIAAYHRRAEQVMIPLLDIMQSIPVLSFLPGVMLAMVALFQHSQIGVELGAILLIFTGQVWNLAFSFYSSLKSIPSELREAAQVYRFNSWQRLINLELPFSALGLVWNSMVSFSSGWFSLMVCEMFVLGNRDFRLRGLGSYLQTAASAGNTSGIMWGLLVLFVVIVLLDQLIWRPATVWAERFKFEQVEGAAKPHSLVLSVLRSSRGLERLQRRTLSPLAEHLNRVFARREEQEQVRESRGWMTWVGWLLAGGVIAGSAFAVVHVSVEILSLNHAEVGDLMRSTGATLLRVVCALVIGAAWAIPAGVAIGSSPRLARIAQPIVQIAAAVPATAFFPILLLLLDNSGHGLGLAPIALMLLGTQWYILFNVIAGAMGTPGDLKEAAHVFGFRKLQRWKILILPGIFPALVTGLVTAAGGAWNASIMAEYCHFKGHTFQVIGLGSLISRAADSGNFEQLLMATVVLAVIVVITNRLVWRPLYGLVETRFRLEN